MATQCEEGKACFPHSGPECPASGAGAPRSSGGSTPARLGRVPLALLLSLAALSAGAIDIPVEVPERGYVSLQIRNAAGEVVGNAISPTPLEFVVHPTPIGEGAL